jgi:hypothetical protein
MARYSAGVVNKAGVNTADTIMFGLRPTSTVLRIKVQRVGFYIQVAPTAAPIPYLCRALTNGTSSTTIAGLPRDPAEPGGTGTVDSAWSVAPTVTAANKIDVGALTVTAGGGWVWDFRDSPLILPAATTVSSLFIVNNAATGVTLGNFTCQFEWDE